MKGNRAVGDFRAVRDYRVVIAEDSAVVRERLVILLSGIEGLSVVAAMDTSPEAICLIYQVHPDAVVLGANPGDPTVFIGLIAIKEDRPETFVIALSNTPCAPCRDRFLAAGADLFLDKSCEFDRIGPALAQARVRAHREGRLTPPAGSRNASEGNEPEAAAPDTLRDSLRHTDGDTPSPKGEGR